MLGYRGGILQPDMLCQFKNVGNWLRVGIKAVLNMIGSGLIQQVFNRFLTNLDSGEHFGILAVQIEPEYL